jgi:hypothetical protein
MTDFDGWAGIARHIDQTDRSEAERSSNLVSDGVCACIRRVALAPVYAGGMAKAKDGTSVLVEVVGDPWTLADHRAPTGDYRREIRNWDFTLTLRSGDVFTVRAHAYYYVQDGPGSIRAEDVSIGVPLWDRRDWIA